MMKQLGFFATLVSTASAVHLTPENWDTMTAGKSVFIKFYAPWCGHCKALAPDWDTLTNEFEGSATQLVAEVDCTDEEAEVLCNDNGVEGFPTLKYGDPSDLQDYEGGREYDELLQFATKELKPMCGVNNLDLCPKSKRAEIEKLLEMDVEELTAAVESEGKKLQDAEMKFQEEVDKLQAKYEEMSGELEEAKKASGIGLMKSVLAKKRAGDVKDEL